jgi:hypothetical protein
MIAQISALVARMRVTVASAIIDKNSGRHCSLLR